MKFGNYNCAKLYLKPILYLQNSITQLSNENEELNVKLQKLIKSDNSNNSITNNNITTTNTNINIYNSKILNTNNANVSANISNLNVNVLPNFKLQANHKSNNISCNYKSTEKDKGGISVISSNEEIFNPFTNNQNITHMTKFYEMNPDQIKARIDNIISELSNLEELKDEKYISQLNEITCKFGELENNVSLMK